MAEYKNGFSALGNVPISPDRRSSDLQTGRAVYVDEADYSADAKYKDKVDTVEYEGYHREAPIVVPEKGSSEGGGGGSSDFSTATVTLVNNTDDYVELYFPKFVVFASDPSGTYTFAGSSNGDPHTTEEVTIALAEDGCVVLPSGISGNIEVSGDATIGFRGMIIITGDCTITIS